MNHNILDPHHADVFVEFFGIVQSAVHSIAKEKQWWSSEDADFLDNLAEHHLGDTQGGRVKEIAQKMRDRNEGEIIALMHSELSEALEGARHGNPPSDKIPEFSSMEEELGDCIVRIMDLSEQRGYRVAEAVIEKIKFNHTRSVRHGGKRF